MDATTEIQWWALAHKLVRVALVAIVVIVVIEMFVRGGLVCDTCHHRVMTRTGFEAFWPPHAEEVRDARFVDTSPGHHRCALCWHMEMEH
jgi:hypothetical protein